MIKYCTHCTVMSLMMKAIRSGTENSSLRRIRCLSAALHPQLRFHYSASDEHSITIGGITKKLVTPKSLELVPRGYLPQEFPQTILQHLKWMMQKDLLGQDMFLIGPPGPLKRQLAMMYLELTARELEYVALSRDTTDMDLKQRREMVKNCAIYVDQAAIKAAVHGRVLVLDGLEKVERNVMPVLNNLLENREMQLDDGRFLMAAGHYDGLLGQHSSDELRRWNLVRVHQDFRVIALGLPVPRFRGNSLDPPLRSRFQARNVGHLPHHEQLQLLGQVMKEADPERLTLMLQAAETLVSPEAVGLGLMDFPLDNFPKAAELLRLSPHQTSGAILSRLYPHRLLTSEEAIKSTQQVLKSFHLDERSIPSAVSTVRISGGRATVTISAAGSSVDFQVSAGTLPECAAVDFVNTEHHSTALSEMLASHAVHDICVVGPRGSGKSTLVCQFASLLGYEMEEIFLYEDMTSRDLVQQRMTLPSGDTCWRHAPLINAMLEGKIAVLDGLHRANMGTLGILSRVLHERQLVLFDGSQLMGEDRFASLGQELALTRQQLNERKIFAIHPSFRIIATAEPPTASLPWLHSEVLPMFLFHQIQMLNHAEESAVLSSLLGTNSRVSVMLDLVSRLRHNPSSPLKGVIQSLSTRQLLRIGRRLVRYEDDSVHHLIHKACMSKFLPVISRAELSDALVSVPEVPMTSISRKCEVTNGKLRVGRTEVPVYVGGDATKIPDTLFYENAVQLEVLEDMMRDFNLGEHLLLVGNQGVGKNKLVDRFLHLTRRPREYLQLHRDTTVQSLTMQPTVEAGIIHYEDSPLVKAVKSGNVLVIDEADKAPTNVTCILKALLQTGQMHLSDGRTIVPVNMKGNKENVIVTHPDFRMIVLANRPGFPFLGNDFFASLGDLFSCHVIDNPDIQSELEMLSLYGPNVEPKILEKLVAAFGELRQLSDQGMISYPYSTREVVNIVKHIQKFPEEGLSQVLDNIFDFDSYSKETLETIIEIMHKHGIPIGGDPNNVSLAKTISLPNFQLKTTWTREKECASVKGIVAEVKIKGPLQMPITKYPLERFDARATSFTEQEAFWMLPLHESNQISSMCAAKSANNTDLVHVLTVDPYSLFTVDLFTMEIRVVDLYDILPYQHRPKLSLFALPASLDSSVVVHEGNRDILLSVNTTTGLVHSLHQQSLIEQASARIGYRKSIGQQLIYGIPSFDERGLIFLHRHKGSDLHVLSVRDASQLKFALPFSLESMQLVSPTDLLLHADDGRSYTGHLSPNGQMVIHHLENYDRRFTVAGTESLDDKSLSGALDQTISAPNRSFLSSDSFVNIAVGMPDLSSIEVFVSARNGASLDNPTSWCLTEPGCIIRPLTLKQYSDDSIKDVAGFLELINPKAKTASYIAIPRIRLAAVHSRLQPHMKVASLSSERIVSIDGTGCMRLWQISTSLVNSLLTEWRKLIGNNNRTLQLTTTKPYSGTTGNMPKHGKVDKTGKPHVGGNTWAGGTGGYGTAGMGGFAGPYRLDAGHDVTQVPDSQKASVPEEVRRAAREMADQAFKDRLREIKMSDFDGDAYKEYYESVRRPIEALRIVLDGLQARGKERDWLRHQTDGELDDAKLVEGLTGEKSVYKRRGVKPPEPGTPQTKPKLIRLVCDVSGSMYRFNGYDGRLQRQLEAMMMVMEALLNYEQKVQYEIYGHSGDGYNLDLVKATQSPRNAKERLAVLKTMHAHSQFCMSGDNTVEATRHAIESMRQKEADQKLVVILSDANLDRYGISPRTLSHLLKQDPDVTACIIFIGSLGDQADRLVKQLPAGHAFICMDTSKLPQILQQIFTTTLSNT